MTLFEKLIAKKNLYSAWKSLQKNPSSHGIDGITIKDFQADLDKNISLIRRSIKEKEFAFKPLSGRLIDKEGGKKRPLKIPAIGDRVVQRAIRNVIERYFRKFNLPCSYGYIEEKSREHAIERISDLRDKGFSYVLEADIKEFFNAVNQEILIEKIFAILPDESINHLIQDALKTEIGNKKEFTKDELSFFPDGSIGISQGGILSPLFANLYLSNFDKKMLDDKFKLIRYADDFVVLCKSKEEASKAYSIAKALLKDELKLDIHELGPESKTRIIHFSQGFTFLGFSFNHQIICPSEKNRNKFRTKIGEILNPKSSDNLVDATLKLKNTINGWGNANSFCHLENIKRNSKDDTMIRILESLEGYIRNNFFILLDAYKMKSKEGSWQGYHLLKFGVPKLTDFLSKKTLKDLTTKNKKKIKAKTAAIQNPYKRNITKQVLIEGRPVVV